MWQPRQVGREIQKVNAKQQLSTAIKRGDYLTVIQQKDGSFFSCCTKNKKSSKCGYKLIG